VAKPAFAMIRASAARRKILNPEEKRGKLASGKKVESESIFSCEDGNVR